ncbi:MAG: hypothetical protein ACKOD9_18505 [Rubrivivax sp.]
MTPSPANGPAAAELQAPPADAVAADVKRALDEDVGSGDLTASLVPWQSLSRLAAP